MVNATTQPLNGLEKDPVATVHEARWAQERSGRVRKVSARAGFDPRTVLPLVSRHPGPQSVIHAHHIPLTKLN